MEGSEGENSFIDPPSVRISRVYVLGEGNGPLASCCMSTQFEHYPLSAYTSARTGDEIEMEICDGQQVTFQKEPGAEERGIFGGDASGVMFGCSSCPPLSGRVLMRILLHSRTYALGIGIGSLQANMTTDPEHDPGFLGLYHGGYSTNVCAYAQRTHTTGSNSDWRADCKLAILLDFDEGTMQCYEGLWPFGDAVPITRDNYWPVVVLWRNNDSASIAVDFV